MSNLKSMILTEDTLDTNKLGRSYYCFCLEQALIAVGQARALVKGDRVDDDHELPKIERLLADALEAS